MITELITHLQQSPEAGTPVAIWRDDERPPFSDLSSTPLLIREQTGSLDRHISAQQYDLFLYSEGNGTNAQMGAINSRIRALELWLVNNRQYTGGMYGIEITGSVSGPYKDGQNRWYYSISIQVRRNPNNTSV